MALCRGITDNQLLAYGFREPARQRVYPVTDADLDMSFNLTIADVGTPISLSPPRGKPESHANSVYGNGSLEEKDDPDQEKGDLVGDLASREIVDPVIDCRDSNASAWFYFPHVELLFLLFAFEGFVAAQVYGIQQSGCLPVQIVAAVVLVRLVFCDAKRTSYKTFSLTPAITWRCRLSIAAVEHCCKGKMLSTSVDFTHPRNPSSSNFHYSCSIRRTGAVPGAHVHRRLPHYDGSSLL